MPEENALSGFVLSGHQKEGGEAYKYVGGAYMCAHSDEPKNYDQWYVAKMTATTQQMYILDSWGDKTGRLI